MPQHVLRFWETRFPQIIPLERAGGRRYYRPEDVQALRTIKERLYDQGYTIKGVQKLIRAHGVAGLRDAPESSAPLFEGDGRIEPTIAPPGHGAPKAAEALSQAQDDSRPTIIVEALRAALSELSQARRALSSAARR